MSKKVFREYKHPNFIVSESDIFYKNSTQSLINLKDPLFQYLIINRIIKQEPEKSPSTLLSNDLLHTILDIYLIPEISNIIINYLDNITNKSCSHLCDNYCKSCCDDKREIQWIDGVSIAKNI